MNEERFGKRLIITLGIRSSSISNTKISSLSRISGRSFSAIITNNRKWNPIHLLRVVLFLELVSTKNNVRIILDAIDQANKLWGLHNRNYSANTMGVSITLIQTFESINQKGFYNDEKQKI